MDEDLTLLVVDDDELDRLAVRRALRAAGLPVTLHEADTGADALERLAETSYDCIVLDYHLCDYNGLELLRLLRSRADFTPMIVLTGQGGEQLAVELMKAGASDYLTKGALSAEQLAQRIRGAVRLQRAEALAHAAEQARQEGATRLQLLADASQLLSATLDAPTILRQLALLVTSCIADCCLIDLHDTDGSLVRMASEVAAGVHDQALPRIAAALPLDSEEMAGPRAVVQRGRPQVWPVLAASEQAWPLVWPKGQADALIASVLSVPLPARGRIMGALTLVRLQPRSAYRAEDVAFAADLGRRAAMALDNAALYDEARRAIQMRDAFLSVASHELKTPLASLYGNVQLLERRMLRDGTLSERDQRSLRVVKEQSVRLDKMVTALLDTSRLQAGQLSVERQPLDLVGLVVQLAEELRPSLERHHLELELAPSAVVLGDDVRLQQVLHNLAQNAEKYSPEGGRIGIRVTTDAQWARVAISDQGIGIPKGALPRLFRRFYRAENAQQSQISGIGLGLYVVYEIVRLHGGDVTVESEEGQGSTFTVVLPLAEPENRGMLSAES